MSKEKATLALFIEDLPEAEEQSPSEVICQIYPASFADADNDGLGDIRGITSKLDYIKSLNADAIWLSPFYLSPPGPEGDGGYAVSDYRKIDPRFGTMEDFRELLDAAHARGLKIYTDFVIAHTADDHEWFQKSRRREEPYTDYYVWSDGIKLSNGKTYPPNNWKSVFGGLAWTWDEERKQYYMHHFLKSQPALNLNIAKVQDASLAEMKFWLDMGVDGFRIDALPFANHDPQLRHNPWRDGQWPRAQENWVDQYFQHSLCQAQTVELVERIRALMDGYSEKRTTLGEAVCGPDGGAGSIPVAASYVQPGTGLDMCYTDAFTSVWGYPTQETLKTKITNLLDTFPSNGGHCNSIDNHDTPRSASRMTSNIPPSHKPAACRQLMQFFACLPGSFSMYQGQELGLPQARIPEDIPLTALKDPTAKTLGEGRDGCRTPMPWNASEKNAGFTTSDQPYLPVPESHYDLAVDRQESLPDSMLHFTRRLLAWRKAQPALLCGQTVVIDNGGDVLAFIRYSKEQAVLCLFNMSGRKHDFRPADHLGPTLLKKLKINPGQTVHLEAYAASFHGARPVGTPIPVAVKKMAPPPHP